MTQNVPDPDEIRRNQAWFEEYTKRLRDTSVSKQLAPGVRHPCPCCGYITLETRGDFEICHVCFWEDDGQDNQDADGVRGGPNGKLSLTQARANFRAFGACEEKMKINVRPPTKEEIPSAPQENSGDTR